MSDDLQKEFENEMATFEGDVDSFDDFDEDRYGNWEANEIDCHVSYCDPPEYDDSNVYVPRSLR